MRHRAATAPFPATAPASGFDQHHRRVLRLTPEAGATHALDARASAGQTPVLGVFGDTPDIALGLQAKGDESIFLLSATGPSVLSGDLQLDVVFWKLTLMRVTLHALG